METLNSAATMADGVEHLLEDRTRQRLVRFEAELADNTAHGASVEQARCQRFRQKRA
jgi:hypothetical protein